MKKSAAVFSALFICGCANKAPEPANLQAVFNKVQAEHLALKKDFNEFKRDANDNIAKLELQIVEERDRTNKMLLGMLGGLSAGIKKAFGAFAAVTAKGFNGMHERITKLEELHRVKAKTKKK